MAEEPIIGIYVGAIVPTKPDFIRYHPAVDGYLVDKTTGHCLKADSSDMNIYTHTSPFALHTPINNDRRSPSYWRKLLVINDCFSSVNSDSKIFLFEIRDTVHRPDSQNSETVRIAWAFLIPLASDGSMNTSQEVSLQFFNIGRSCKISHKECDIYHLYADHKRVKFPGTIRIAIKEVLPNKSKAVIEEVPKTKTLPDEKPAQEIAHLSVQSSKSWPWSRLPTQTCKIPNHLHKEIQLDSGVGHLKFSRNGLYFAASTFSQIHIFEVMSGVEVTVFEVHSRHIYGLEWSPDDQYLLSVSNNYRAIVWSLSQKTPVFVLPHPSHVTSGVWFGGNDQIITGGSDSFIRHWRNDGNGFHLVSEMLSHKTAVFALAIGGSTLFSGGNEDNVLVWNFSGNSWHFQKKLTGFSGMYGPVNSIHILPKGNRVLVSVSLNGAYLFDVASGILLKKYICSFSWCQSALSPCGSLFFSLHQHGGVTVWDLNVDTREYRNLFPLERLFIIEGCVDYHPHEHMIGVGAITSNYPIYIFKYKPKAEGNSISVDMNALSLSRLH